MHFSVTCECGVGGMMEGDRSIFPEQEGQLRGEPVRSLAIKCSACAGLYVAGRGLRMTSSKKLYSRPLCQDGRCGKTNRLGYQIQVAPAVAPRSVKCSAQAT